MYNCLLSRIVGGKITQINRVCDLISLEISCENETFYFHIQTFFRVLKNNKIIVSTNDLYRCRNGYDEEVFEWDVPGASLFDESVEFHQNSLSTSHILRVKKKKNGDVIISLENDIQMQILIDTVVSEEKYRLFNNTETFVYDN